MHKTAGGGAEHRVMRWKLKWKGPDEPSALGLRHSVYAAHSLQSTQPAALSWQDKRKTGVEGEFLKKWARGVEPVARAPSLDLHFAFKIYSVCPQYHQFHFDRKRFRSRVGEANATERSSKRPYDLSRGAVASIRTACLTNMQLSADYLRPQ